MGKNSDSIKFTLHKITTEQFAIIADPPANDDKVSFKTDFTFGCNMEEKAIGVFLKISFENDSNPFLLVEAGCHFLIEDISWESIFFMDKNKLVLPKGFASHLLMICMGTTRGILHSKTENTRLNNYYLPLVNVSEMIKSDLELCNP